MSVAAGEWSSKRIAALPLAVTLLVHLLLVLAWFARPASHPADETARPESVLVLVPPAKPRPPAAPALPKVPAPARPAVPAPAPLRPPAETMPSAAPATPAISQPPAADNAPPAPFPSKADELLRDAKRQAGKIDRELRAGKPGVPREADTPMARFRDGLSAAHVDRSYTLVEESYTGPDGVTVYRYRNGDKVYCRRSGSSVPDMIGRTPGAVLAGAGRFDTLGKAGSAGATACPTGDHDWVRQ